MFGLLVMMMMMMTSFTVHNSSAVVKLVNDVASFNGVDT